MTVLSCRDGIVKEWNPPNIDLNRVDEILKQSAENETLYKTREEKQMFYNQLNCRKNSKLIKSMDNLNDYFSDNNFPYQIIEEDIQQETTRYRHSWKVIKKTNNTEVN